jgi:hypothetical protein
MKQYLAIIAMDIRLALRLRAVIFFNYLFPLIFFFTFAAFMGRTTEQMAYVVRMSVTLGVLGSGFFGAGIRAIQDRELNILRRYKVTPITPAPLLVGSMVTGWLIFLPYIVLLLYMAHALYHLGGATVPSEVFHGVMRTIHNFVPSTYLVDGMINMMSKGQNLFQNWVGVLVMLVTAFIGGFISFKLFRWEKEEKIRGSAKWWVVVALLPFIALGVLESMGVSLFK